MKSSIIFLIIYFVALNSWSQNSDSVQTKEKNSIHDIRKNSFYVELGGSGILGSVNYDRLIPVADKRGILLGVTVGFLGDIVPEINYFCGKSKNFLEIGVGYSIPELLISPQIGYRYQGNKGLLFRAMVIYLKSTKPESFGDFPMAGLSFGYSY